MADSTQIGGGGPVSIAGTFNTTGTGTHSGTNTHSGVNTFSGGFHDSKVTEQSGTAAEDLTSHNTNHTFYIETAQAGDITLPQATAANKGMVITVLFGANCAASDVKLGFADGGSTVMVGTVSTGALDAGAGAENRSFALASSAKILILHSTAVTKAGGAAGSKYVFNYIGANKVFVEARGLITTGTPGPTADASSGTGI